VGVDRFKLIFKSCNGKVSLSEGIRGAYVHMYIWFWRSRLSEVEPTACWFSCRGVERHHAVSMSTSLLDVSPSRHKLQTTPLPPPSLDYHNNILYTNTTYYHMTPLTITDIVPDDEDDTILSMVEPVSMFGPGNGISWV